MTDVFVDISESLSYISYFLSPVDRPGMIIGLIPINNCPILASSSVLVVSVVARKKNVPIDRLTVSAVDCCICELKFEQRVWFPCAFDVLVLIACAGWLVVASHVKTFGSVGCFDVPSLVLWWF